MAATASASGASRTSAASPDQEPREAHPGHERVRGSAPPGQTARRTLALDQPGGAEHREEGEGGQGPGNGKNDGDASEG